MNYSKLFLLSTLLLFFVVNASFSAANDTVYYEYWDICSLTGIGGYKVTKYGEPVVVISEKGKTVLFDGINDALVVDKNPFGDAKEFTFEVLFKPKSGEPNITSEPRFICFWDPADASGPRMTIEIRVTADSLWYFDGFLKTDNDDLTLIDDSKTHPANEWAHAAVTYKDKVFTTYVNGQQELSGTVEYLTKVFNSSGKTSVGARYNLARWFNGEIKAVKVTHAALTPENFFSIADTVISSGIAPVYEQNKVEIYPVPAKNEIVVNNTGKDTLHSITITNPSGQVVYQMDKICDKEQVVDISQLKNGIYFVALQSEKSSHTQKIIVLH